MPPERHSTPPAITSEPGAYSWIATDRSRFSSSRAPTWLSQCAVRSSTVSTGKPYFGRTFRLAR